MEERDSRTLGMEERGSWDGLQGWTLGIDSRDGGEGTSGIEERDSRDGL
jgi:hypothetical protein